MQRITRIATVLLLATLGLFGCASTSGDGWVKLIDGTQGLDNFHRTGDANWRAEDGTIMAIRHREQLVEAVQFHPESVLTEGGYQMLANWLATCGDVDAPRRAEGLSPLMGTA